MKTYIAAFFLLLSATFVAAHPYLIQRLGIEQGLSNNYVLSITQDKQGFLWFATEEGLNKFDEPALSPTIKRSNLLLFKALPATNSMKCTPIPCSLLSG